ncbi:uncharacterized protein LOC124671319 [Lolium rigidum]|uniref:uncharacterized protein LOC124671319 n=1 Tax=Lolium rigidum TaxID=89674 RepID=UPI001F5CD822|nr:uncharacterized protein LOC124671319 [Lolium rigidum]
MEMEAAEDDSLEPAIAWLVQTILATLLVDKLDTWIRQAGFGDDIERLKSEIRRVGMVVSAVKGRAIGNEPLAQSLVILKELLYDADDVVDELDYYRLQQQVEGVTRDESKGMHGVERVDEIPRDANTPNSSVGKLRSVVWQHFKITEKDNGKPVKSVCRYCGKEFTCETKNGTSSMSKHIHKICKNKPRVLPPNLSSTDDAITNAVPVVIGDSCSRKRRRVDEDSTQITASNTQSPWDKDILSSRIEKITSQLQDIRGDLGEFLKLHGSDLASSSNHHPSIMPALKLSYDRLPYYLQQCFSYCSIFPDSYQFRAKDLVHIWISQGFVKCNHSSKKLEEIGQFYLTDLVNLGFFQKVGEEEDESSLGSQSSYSICGLMHDFARMCSLVDPTHLRYVKHKSDDFDRPLPLVLTKFFHLQVLDVGSNNDPGVPDGMYNLVSLRHLVAGNGVYSSVANIGSMTSLQELHNFKVQPLSGSFEISQLQSMNELVELWVSQLDNVESREEAYGAGLRDKVHLAKLHLSWKDALSDEELMPMDDGGASSEPSMGTAREVLEGLEPYMNLKHLQISGYNGATSPTWLASNISVTSLQTLHLDGCRGWRILPSLESLPFIRKLKLRNMQEVTEVLVPSLEEIVLIGMPKLVRCSSTSVEGLSSVLRALEIKECQELKEFDLFENDDKFETWQRSWLPGLRKLVLSDCPHLKVSKPVPPSTISCELNIRGVSIFPSMKGLSSKKLYIGKSTKREVFKYETDVSSDELRILNDQILAFDNLRNLKWMRIAGCRNLRSFSLEGFSHLVSLKSLEISRCRELFCSDRMPDATLEDLIAANWKAFPCLESLSIVSCGIGGKWLSLLLRHAPDLEELCLKDILPIGKEFYSGEEDDPLTGLAQDEQDGLVHVPLNFISSLKKITIDNCRCLTFSYSEEGFSGFTSLQELIIGGCTELLLSFLHKDGNDLTRLKTLVARSIPGLKCLQLHSCTALEELRIKDCESLVQLEGLQSLGRLRHLAVSGCPGLRPCFQSFSRQGCELFPQLETLVIDDPSVLTMLSFCNHLTSLRRLHLRHLVLSEEQGGALVLLTSLQELEFNDCPSLPDLPAGLHLLLSLKRLKILYCQGISRLPETGLPLSLEELVIRRCSNELNGQCKGLATSKLRVKINDSSVL